MRNMQMHDMGLWTGRGFTRAQSTVFAHNQCTDSTGKLVFGGSDDSYTRFTRLYAARLSTPKIHTFTSVIYELSTLSTQPTITTTYINKGD